MLHVAIVDDDVHPVSLDLSGVLPDDFGEAVGRLFQRYDHVCRLEALAGKIADQRVQFV